MFINVPRQVGFLNDAHYNEYMLNIMSVSATLDQHLVSTANQKVLRLLAKFSDKEFYERQIARTLGIAYGSAHNALSELYASGLVHRRQEGKMFFYSIDASNPIIIEFKKLANLLLVEPLASQLKAVSDRIILYGSCAQGADDSRSDVDLFVVSNKKKQALDATNNFKFPRGFENIHLQAVIKTPAEMLRMGASDQAFLAEVERGIVLWERAAGESGLSRTASTSQYRGRMVNVASLPKPSVRSGVP